MLANQATHRGAQAIGAIISNRFNRFLFGLFTRHRGGGEDGNQLTGQHGRPFPLQNIPQHTRLRGRHFQHHLVGLDVDQYFVTGDQIARFFVPGGDSGIGH